MAKETNEVSKKSKSKTGAKKAETKKTTKTKSTKAVSTNKKSPSKSAKKTTTKKSSVKRTTKKVAVKNEVLEYYDLPYRYKQTVVKILAQTPNTLFVYWDISDTDRNRYIEEFGRDFFNDTIPVLIIHNKTKNYSFEIEINDFANSWYFNVNDTSCEYEVEYGRRSKSPTINIPNNYLQIVSSNKIESPNDHILFEENQKTVFFRNVKTNTSYSKDIVNLNFMHKIGKIYNIYDVYKKIYKDENLNEIQNPSSY